MVAALGHILIGIRAHRLSIAVGAMLAASVSTAAERPIGFYAPWDAASAASLRDHGSALSVVVPAWISVTGKDHSMTVMADALGHVTLAALPRRPKLWLMVQNASSGNWDGIGAATLLRDPDAVGTLLESLEAQAVKERANGIVIDFEELPDNTQADLIAFLAKARTLGRAHGWVIAVAVPVDNPAWNLTAIGMAADRVILMAYDEHWQTGQPGPIASDPWFRSVVAKAVAKVPPGHAIAGLASYAYDWPAVGPATILSVEQAKSLAEEQGAQLLRDSSSGAMHFGYITGNVTHQVWLSDAVTVTNQAKIATAVKAAGVALWRLGSEDSQIWTRPL